MLNPLIIRHSNGKGLWLPAEVYRDHEVIQQLDQTASN